MFPLSARAGVGIQLTWNACRGRRYQVQFRGYFLQSLDQRRPGGDSHQCVVGTFLDGTRGARGYYRVAEVP